MCRLAITCALVAKAIVSQQWRVRWRPPPPPLRTWQWEKRLESATCPLNAGRETGCQNRAGLSVLVAAESYAKNFKLFDALFISYQSLSS